LKIFKNELFELTKKGPYHCNFTDEISNKMRGLRNWCQPAPWANQTCQVISSSSNSFTAQRFYY